MKQKIIFTVGMALILASLALAVPEVLQESIRADESPASSLVSTFQESIISALQCGDTDSSSPMDAGRVYSAQGTSTGEYAGTENEGSWQDYCRDEHELVEYFCGGGQNKVKFNKITCLSGCSNGACVSPPYCVDKDGGISDKVKGNIYVVSSGINELALGLTPTQDACVDGTILQEHYCDPLSLSGISSTQISCEYGCTNGKCRRTPMQAAVQAPTEEQPPATASTPPPTQQPPTASQPPGIITLTPGQATTINGIGVSVNTQLNSLTIAENMQLRLGTNQIDGASFALVATPTSGSSSSSGSFGFTQSAGSGSVF